VRVYPLLLLASLATSSLTGCLPARSVVYSSPLPGMAPDAVAGQLVSTAGIGAPVAASDRHVIVISIDGLRPDAIERFDATTLQRLMREGRYSLHAQTILPSITLPSHTSMLTGVGPDVHGITWNNNQVADRGRVQVPTMLTSARERGLLTAAIVSKGKLNHLLAPGSADYFVVPAGNGSWSASRTAQEVDDYLAENRPNLLFVHLREPDRFGHLFGWMGMVYGWAVGWADDAVEEILESADDAFGPDNYTVIVTADHGGHGHNHGSDDPSSQTIPWIVAGQDVVESGELTDGIRTVDTAATALWLLGVPLPATYSGAPVIEAFSADLVAVDGVAAGPVSH
jgi:arylsulfatase A-like enzyme